MTAGFNHVRLKDLQHGLEPQGSRLHRVCEEVCFEEPLSWVDVFLRTESPETGSTPVRPEAGDAIDHSQLFSTETGMASLPRIQFDGLRSRLHQPRTLVFRCRQS